MRELLGRLTVLDPAASESLKIIEYFDALVAGGAGAEAIVRAAAILGATTAGACVRGRASASTPTARVSTTGTAIARRRPRASGSSETERRPSMTQ